MGRTLGGNTFVAEEERFLWQKPINEFDAFYTLPSALTKQTSVFGTSTREDWENTYKNKRDGNNPNSGPGQNGRGDVTKLSTIRSQPNLKFGFASRNPSFERSTTPGPKYNVEGAFKDGPTNGKIAISFNKDKRKPLWVSSTDAMYDPRLPKGKSMTIGKKVKKKQFSGSDFRSPGPIYDMQKYDFKSGPSYSFGGSRSDRFSGPGSTFA